MALPPWLDPYSQRFINAYGRQIFGPNWTPDSEMDPQAVNLDQQTAQFNPYQEHALQGYSDLTNQSLSMAQQGFGGITPALYGQYVQDPVGAGSNPFLAGMRDTAGGQYLDPSTNPWLQKTYEAAARPMVQQFQQSTMPGITAAAQRAGQMGSSAMNELYGTAESEQGRALNELATNIYGGNYQAERGRMDQASQAGTGLYANATQAERGRQIQAASMVPGMQQAMYQPYQQLFGAGATQQQQEQAMLDTDYANRTGRYEQPFNQLSGYGSAMLQAGGGGETTQHSTTTTKGGGSLLCNFLYNHALTDRATRDGAEDYGRTVPRYVLLGYRAWARYLVRAMERSPWLTWALKPFVLAWAKEMKFRVRGGESSKLGKVLLFFGEPASGIVGLLLRRRPSTVIRRIRAVHVGVAIKSATVWSFAHIRQKVFKRKPTLTNSDSAPAIIRPRLPFVIQAPGFHTIPRMVSRRYLMPTIMTVCYRLQTQTSLLNAAAACRLAAQKIFADFYCASSTSAVANPQGPLAVDRGAIANSQFSKSSIFEIGRIRVNAVFWPRHPQNLTITRRPMQGWRVASQRAFKSILARFGGCFDAG